MSVSIKLKYGGKNGDKKSRRVREMPTVISRGISRETSASAVRMSMSKSAARRRLACLYKGSENVPARGNRRAWKSSEGKASISLSLPPPAASIGSVQEAWHPFSALRAGDKAASRYQNKNIFTGGGYADHQRLPYYVVGSAFPRRFGNLQISPESLLAPLDAAAANVE